ncbi:MAG: hypothetical protein KBS35_00120 [Mycoplasma sp.]|nr:hypothetical protein [Candidatus Hennigella equi]
MKKILLIPTLATSVVAPIIAITGCGKTSPLVKWDFKQNQEYDYKMDIPDATVTPSKAFNQYLDMVGKNPSDFAHEYLLSVSNKIKNMLNPPSSDITVTLDINAWTEEIKVNAFDKSEKRISFDLKANIDFVHTIHYVNASYSKRTEKIKLDLSYENMPWSYCNDRGRWKFTTGTAMLYGPQDVRDFLINDKKWSISGSLDVNVENETNASLGFKFADSNFKYNFSTAASDEIWLAEDTNIRDCCMFSYGYIDHRPYYMSNIPVNLAE